MRTRTIHPIAVALATGFAATMLLTACSNPLEEIGQNIAEAGTEKIIEGATDADVDIDFDGSGASVPDGWPSDVSLPDGKIMLAISQDGTQMVQIQVSGEDALDQMLATMAAAGFTESESGDLGIADIHIFEREDMGATVALSDLDDQFFLQVTVTPLGE